MYCETCGAILTDRAAFCGACGHGQTAVQPARRVGFSPLINDPAFKRYVKNSNSWAVIFSLILALISIVGFYIYGATGSEMEKPQALYIGLGIGGMFLLIALLQVLGRKRSRTWDGTVADKSVKHKQRRKYYGDNDYYIQKYTEYEVIVRADNGKLHSMSAEDDTTMFEYYQIGDRVRHHAGLNSYEKYDKSRDTFIPCAACATLNEPDQAYCFRCNCPLLK